MSFKEGFTAIEEIQNSGRRLGDTVERIEALEAKLEGLVRAQAQIESMIGQAKGVLTGLKTSSGDLSKEFESFTEQAKTLPDRIANILVRAERRIEERQTGIAELVDDLPRLVEAALDRRLSGLLDAMETRLRDQLRSELQETRTAMRDMLEVALHKQDKSLERIAGDIISEMPRGLLGRRGKT